MLIETLNTPLARVLSADATTTPFPAYAPTLVKPSGIDLVSTGQFVQNTLFLMPYGAGVATNTFGMNVIGWRRDNNGPRAWYPVIQGGFTCTLCTMAGVAGGIIDASHLLVDTITLTAGTATPGVSVEVIAAGSNQPAHIMLSIKGAALLQFIFDTQASATGCNCVYGLL